MRRGNALSRHDHGLGVLRTRADRRNLILNIADGATALFGISLIDPATVLGPFLRRVGAGDSLIGAFAAAEPAFRIAAALLAARLAEGLRRKKPAVLAVGVLQRLHMPVMALLAALFLPQRPGLFLGLYGGSLAVFAASNGAAMVVWPDLVAKVTPVARRGFLFAWRWNAAILPVLAAAWAISRWLPRARFPWGYVAIFAAAGAAFWLSYVFVAYLRERGAGTVSQRPGTLSYLAGLPSVFREDGSFACLLVSDSLSVVAESGVGVFLVLTAEDRFAVRPEAVLGTYMMIQLASVFVGNVFAARAGDARGHKATLAARGPLIAAACAWGVLAPGPAAYAVTFVLWGLARAATSVSQMPIIMEFGGEARRPRYYALWLTTWSLSMSAGPLLGALLREKYGLGAGFAMGAVAALAGTAVLLFGVTDPRRPASPAKPG